MNAAEAQMMEPMGAPRPLEKHIVTESKHSEYSRNEPAPAATASQRRAPSMCTAIGGD